MAIGLSPTRMTTSEIAALYSMSGASIDMQSDNDILFPNVFSPSDGVGSTKSSTSVSQTTSDAQEANPGTKGVTDTGSRAQPDNPSQDTDPQRQGLTLSLSFALVDSTETFRQVGGLYIIHNGTDYHVDSQATSIEFSDGTVNLAGEGPDRLIDPLFYYTHNHDVWSAKMDAGDHYMEFGWREGRNPSAEFDTLYYQAQTTKDSGPLDNPLLDFTVQGWAQGRNPSAGFSTSRFLQTHPELALTHEDPLEYYQQSGRMAGEQPLPVLPPDDPLIDLTYINTHYAQTFKSVSEAQVWFNTVGWTLGESPNAFFNTKYYLNQNPDVERAGVNPLQHFETWGWKEGRDPSSAFSDSGYLTEHPEIAAMAINPLVHFLTAGILSGYQAKASTPHATGPQNPLIDVQYIFQQNPDVAASGLDATSWYNSIGWRRGANPNPLFNTQFYLNQNPDVAAAGCNPLEHYETYGWKEHRDPSVGFSTSKYLAIYQDVAVAGVDPLQHYLEYGQSEGRVATPATLRDEGNTDPLIDKAYIQSHYPDAAATGLSAAAWFNSAGWKIGANPNPYFDTNYYLAHNPDVARSGINPLQHYESVGWATGADPSAEFSNMLYLSHNPDVLAAHTDPLQHFLVTGRAEHRTVYSADPVYLAQVQQPLQATATPPSPSIEGVDTDALDTDGTILFTGAAVAGSTVELATDIGDIVRTLMAAKVDAEGHWSIRIEATALGYGSSEVQVRASDYKGHDTDWSAKARVTVSDPESSARHVGADLRALLESDSINGRDATTDLQALADEADGVHTTMLDLPAGTYIISSTVKVKSNTIIDSPGTVFQGAPIWNSSPNYEYLYHSMFLNSEWDDGGSENIQFRNVTFDRSNAVTDAGYSLRIENASRILVSGCTFRGNGDGTAFEAVDGATISGNLSVGSEDYAFDNWAGPRNTFIVGNSVYVSRFGGISLTAAPTDISLPAMAENNAVVDNHIYGYDRFGIDVNSISDASDLQSTFVSGNALSGPGIGIQVLGRTTNTVVSANVITGSVNGPAILVSSENSVDSSRISSSDVTVTNNRIRGSFVGPLGVAVSVQANGALVSGNSVSDTVGLYPYWLPSSGLTVTGNVANSSPGNTHNQLVGIEAENAVGQIVRLVDNAGNVSVPGAVGLTSGQLAVSRIGAGGIGTPGVLSVYGGAGDTVSLGAGDNAIVEHGERIYGAGFNTFFVGEEAQQVVLDGAGTSQLVVTSVGLDGRYQMGSDIVGIDTVRLLVNTPAESFLVLNGIDGLQAFGTDTPATIVAGGSHQTIHPGLGHTTMIGADVGTTCFSERVWNFNNDIVENLRADDIFVFQDIGPVHGFDLVQNTSTGTTTLSVCDLNKGANIELTGLFAKSQFLETESVSGLSLLFKG